MKKSFVTGLIILLPLALTLVVVVFVLNLLTKPFVGVVQGVMNHYGILTTGFWIFSAEQIQFVVSQILILVAMTGVTVLLGFIARWVLFNWLLKVWDFVMHRIPLVRSIYKTSQDVIHTIFISDTKSFKQVALVPFPQENTYSIGLVTSETVGHFFPNIGEDMMAVFVPTTPNPTSGYLVLYPKKDVKLLSMPVEEAFKYVISCGVIHPKIEERI
ncbi:MAG: DUF502 domain-containing protein [Chlamydiia bacterium]|nr:DUF502 domain-containing protein [Chlamydiia bacterium]